MNNMNEYEDLIVEIVISHLDNCQKVMEWVKNNRDKQCEFLRQIN